MQKEEYINMEQRVSINQRHMTFGEPHQAVTNLRTRYYPTPSERGNSILAIAAEDDDDKDYYPSVFSGALKNRKQQMAPSKAHALPLTKRERFELAYAQSRANEGLFQFENNDQIISLSSRLLKQPCVVFDDPSASMSLLYQTKQDLVSSVSAPRASTSKEQNPETGAETTPRKRQIQFADTAVNAPAKPKIQKESNNQSASCNGRTSLSINSKVKKQWGPSEIVILTSNVKCTVEWYSLVSSFRKFHVIFEVFAILQRVRENEIYYELLLRDKSGPVMQTLFYKMDQPLPELACGQVVRVVGRLLARTRLQAFSVRQARPGEMQRHDLYLSNQSLKTMKRIEQEKEE